MIEAVAFNYDLLLTCMVCVGIVFFIDWSDE